MFLNENISLNVKVENDEELVFEGLLKDFLEINENDDFLLEQFNNTKYCSGDIIEFNDYHIGNWKVKIL